MKKKIYIFYHCENHGFLIHHILQSIIVYHIILVSTIIIFEAIIFFFHIKVAWVNLDFIISFASFYVINIFRIPKYQYIFYQNKIK